MRAFVIRPFGAKSGVDFDVVHNLLIGPALARLGIEGGTTGEVIEQGNIRSDMFQLLLTADLVIADMSIHNPNTYYELGIRHALRERRTFVINCGKDDVPFDLRTDRYLRYDCANPAAKLDDLVAAIRATLESDKKDSPVFQLLPDLVAQEQSRFLPVPREFGEAVNRARANRWPGDLRLLGEEAQTFPWAVNALRAVGRALFKLRSLQFARKVWESVRAAQLPHEDVEANLLLASIYARLDEGVESDLALRRLEPFKSLNRNDWAEAQALLARNHKLEWQKAWKELKDDTERRGTALRSPRLSESTEAYEAAFEADLNHFYSGLNALSLLVLRTALATSLRTVWDEPFEDEPAATRALAELSAHRDKLAAAIDVCITASERSLKREQKQDAWVEISRADLTFLVRGKPALITAAYREALTAQDVDEFHFRSVRDQLEIFQGLDVFPDRVKAALQGVAQAPQPPAAVQPRVLLFTGHMIDAENRPKPRFPRTAEAQAKARQAIREAVEKEIAAAGPAGWVGISGGACGGDILFHEVCNELAVPTEVFLALPPEQYVQHSVAQADADWVQRFYALIDRTKPRVLHPDGSLPRWLQSSRPADGYLWSRTNLWMLFNALARAGAGANLVVIALWNGEPGDKVGGTQDMVERAKKRGGRVIHIRTQPLFGPVA